MKLTATLLAAQLAAITCPAQDLPAPVVPAPAAVAPAAPADHPSADAMPAGVLMERVEFVDTSLPEVIQYLQHEHSRKGGTLNVVVPPEVSQLKIPALSLRNVTTTEILTIAANLLGLTIEPVRGDDGRGTVAFLLRQAPAVPSGTEGGSAGAMPGTAGGGLAPAGAGPVADHRSGAGVSGTVVVQEIAGTSPGDPAAHNVGGAEGGGGAETAHPAARPAKVFGIGTLLPPRGGSPAQQKERAFLMERLIIEIEKFAADWDKEANVRPYEALDLIVVRSSALPVITEAIEAMKQDARLRSTPAPPASVPDAPPAANPQKPADH